MWWLKIGVAVVLVLLFVFGGLFLARCADDAGWAQATAHARMKTACSADATATYGAQQFYLQLTPQPPE